MLFKKLPIVLSVTIFCVFAYFGFSKSFIAQAAQYSCPDGVHTTVGDGSLGLRNGQYICPDGSVGTKANDSTNLPGATKQQGLSAHGLTEEQQRAINNKSSCTAWLNNSAINGLGALCGPGDTSISQLISGVANWIVGILGTVFVIMIVVAGIQIAASAGNPDAIKSGKKRIVNVLISLALLLCIRLIMGLLGIQIT